VRLAAGKEGGEEYQGASRCCLPFSSYALAWRRKASRRSLQKITLDSDCFMMCRWRGLNSGHRLGVCSSSPSALWWQYSVVQAFLGVGGMGLALLRRTTQPSRLRTFAALARLTRRTCNRGYSGGSAR